MEERNQFEKSLDDSLWHAIYNEVVCFQQYKKIYTNYSPEELTELIVNNKSYNQLYNVSDINIDNFEKAIKITLYAEKGFLDSYQDLYMDYPNNIFRINQKGEWVSLTKEEIKLIESKNYDFILNSENLNINELSKESVHLYEKSYYVAYRNRILSLQSQGQFLNISADKMAAIFQKHRDALDIYKIDDINTETLPGIIYKALEMEKDENAILNYMKQANINWNSKCKIHTIFYRYLPLESRTKEHLEDVLNNVMKDHPQAFSESFYDALMICIKWLQSQGEYEQFQADKLASILLKQKDRIYLYENALNGEYLPEKISKALDIEKDENFILTYMKHNNICLNDEYDFNEIFDYYLPLVNRTEEYIESVFNEIKNEYTEPFQQRYL